MKKKFFIIKCIISLAIVGVIYLSYNYSTPYSPRIINEAKYYINHSSDIKYIANNAWLNAKTLIQMMTERAGE